MGILESNGEFLKQHQYLRLSFDSAAFWALGPSEFRPGQHPDFAQFKNDCLAILN